MKDLFEPYFTDLKEEPLDENILRPLKPEEINSSLFVTAEKDSPNKLKYKEIFKEKAIATGAFGIVMRCKVKDKEEIFALKKIEYGTNNLDKDKLEKEQKQLELEVALCQELDHPHIVEFLQGWTTSINSAFILMKYYPRNNLFDFVEKNGPLNQQQNVKMALDVSCAVAYLHGIGIVHRDLKLENILFENGNCILGDFGLAKRVQTFDEQETKDFAGTPGYVPPEMLKRQSFNCVAAEVWSFGILCYVAAMAKPLVPYKEDGTGRYVAYLNRTEGDAAVYFEEDFSSTHPEISTVVKKVLRFRASERPSMEKVHEEIGELSKKVLSCSV